MTSNPNTPGLLVDNFAGGGGASVALESAFGRPVDIAINHDPEAIAMHVANHPDTLHFCESVWDVAPVEATQGQPVAVAWFSPDCKHFSKAKGGRPVEKRIRGLAWVVLRWAAQLESLGYAVDWKELRACDYGAPTIRKRLFLVACRDGLPIRWPAPTHGPAGSGLEPYRTAGECIDWSIPCPSIFDRKKPLAEATLARIARGVQRYVIEAADPFIVPVTHQGDSRVHGVDEPLRTVTTANRGELALVAPTIARHFGHSTGSRIDDPIGTVTAGGGGKAALVAAFLAQHNTGVIGHAATEPVSTIIGKGCTQGLVTAFLSHQRGSNTGGGRGDPRQPMKTLTAGGSHVAEVRAFLMKYYSTGGQWQDCREPMHTSTAKPRLGLVTVAGVDWQIVDIGMRMLTPRELYRAQGFLENYDITPAHQGRPLSKTAQIRMAGNSVCPPVALALLRANVTQARRAVA